MTIITIFMTIITIFLTIIKLEEKGNGDKVVVWCDDHPENNTDEVRTAEKEVCIHTP